MNKAKSLIVALVSVIVTVIPFSTPAPARAASDTCSDVKYIAVGGVGDPTSSGVPGIPPGADVTRVHYSASLAPVGNVGGTTSIREGERNLNRIARDYRSHCPDGQIVVVGYSLGALVSGNVRDKWNNDETMNKNMKFILVSDARSKNGAASMIPSLIPGFLHDGPRPKSNIPTSNICRPNDAICNVGNPFTNPGHALNSTIGYFTGGHAYRSDEIDHTPGSHAPKETRRYVPSTPILLPIPSPYIFDPITRAIIPTAPITPDYTATPIREYLPPIIKNALPSNVLNGTLPPIPRLPR